ncbi:hypothetical protein [uncultured Cloacibacillus sp.]|uniref:hypothetical protein n=1 Tax=uncultured Cloacibacillus sp. TaxID=889794 RepID=UPI0026DBFA9C|nr:hypothetical protein [uncultured Cloacibacillus sp.]
MTGGIGYFDVEDIWERGGLMLGDKTERANTVNYLMGRWNHDTGGVLVVLDSDGGLYERYGGRGMLVDFESANGAIPDVYAAILNHGRFGRSPRETAKIIADVVIRERQDRGSNDQFWSMSGRQALLEYIEYSLLMAYAAKRDWIGSGNALLDSSSAHTLLAGLMDRLIARGADESARWRPLPDARPQPRYSSYKQQQEPQPEPLTNEELTLQSVLKEFYGDEAMPFGDTLAIYTKNGQTNTTSCILRTARAIGRDFFELNHIFNEEMEFYKTLDSVSLTRLINSNEVEGPVTPNVLFIVGGTARDVSSIAAILTLLGCVAAADGAKQEITCVIPDISAWNILDGVAKLKEIFPAALKLIIGCGDFFRVARRTDMSAMACFDQLADMAGGNILWHRSRDEFLKQAFHEHSAGLSVMYGLSDLGGNGLAAIERGGDIQYAYIPQAGDIGISPAERIERTYDASKTLLLWWNAEREPESEPEELETDEDGEDETARALESLTDAIWGADSSDGND